MAPSTTSSAPETKRRVQKACEACRAAKIRCQSSNQPGVCLKCLESKRECVSRTVPRTRRLNKSKPSLVEDESHRPCPSSTTFSINFSIQAQDEIDHEFQFLRHSHDAYISSMISDLDHLDIHDGLEYSQAFRASASSLPSLSSRSSSSSFSQDKTATTFPSSLSSSSPRDPSTSTSSPPSHTPNHNSIDHLHGKPQFNLSSAQSLLTSFHNTLPWLPCITLSAQADVRDMAASSPFMLLAILASASGSRTIQGHNLYDAEFRKVLGLKFVAAGERSIDILQGLLIYCAWYPFHLRPKNKQIFNYLRIASDLVHDLELDHEFISDHSTPPTDQQLEGIRTYLTHCYITSTFFTIWKRHKTLVPAITPWTITCCDILERNARSDHDKVIAAMVRYSNVTNDILRASDIDQTKCPRQALTITDIEAQIEALQARIPVHIASNPSLTIANLFVKVYIDGSLLLTPSRVRTLHPSPLSRDRLSLCVTRLHSLFAQISQLPPSVFSSFTLVDWARLVISIIIAFRLSFPVPECPSFDYQSARIELQLGAFLDTMCSAKEGQDNHGGGSSDNASSSNSPPASSTGKALDVLSASRVVMRVVRDRYQERLAVSPPSRKLNGCPMLDKSTMENYFPSWDPPVQDTFAAPETGDTFTGKKNPIFHDVWATMTMSWGNM